MGKQVTDNDSIKVIGPVKSEQELKQLLKDAPWEVVIYRAQMGDEEGARRLKTQLLRAYRV